MRIGNQTAKSAADAMEPFEFALAKGFDAFEWFADADETGGFAFSSLSEQDRYDLCRRGRVADMRFSVHADWRADPLEPTGAALIKEAIAFAGAIHAPIVVFHLDAQAPVEAMAEALVPLAQKAREQGVCLALENTPQTSPAQFNALFRRLHENPATREHTAMCFDMGHANLHPATRNDYIGYFDQLESHVPIRHVHVHENFGDYDSHLPIGTGPSQANALGVRSLLKRLHQRDYHGSLIMEQWPKPRQVLCKAHDWLKARVHEVERDPSNAG